MHGDESLGKIINREERIVHREKKKVKDGTLRNHSHFVALKRREDAMKGREGKERDKGITSVF